MKKPINKLNQSFKTMAEAYNMTDKVFRRNIAAIRDDLDKAVGRTNYRNLTPKQVEIIIKHLGEP